MYFLLVWIQPHWLKHLSHCYVLKILQIGMPFNYGPHLSTMAMEFDQNNSNFLYGKITIVYISENCFKLSFEDQIECI